MRNMFSRRVTKYIEAKPMYLACLQGVAARAAVLVPAPAAAVLAHPALPATSQSRQTPPPMCSPL